MENKKQNITKITKIINNDILKEVIIGSSYIIFIHNNKKYVLENWELKLLFKNSSKFIFNYFLNENIINELKKQ